MEKCNAVTNAGAQCSRNRAREHEFCRQHQTERTTSGPNYMDRVYLERKNNKTKKEIKNKFVTKHNENVLIKYDDVTLDYRENVRWMLRTREINNEERREKIQLDIDHRRDRQALQAHQQDEIRRTGIDPDAEQNRVRQEALEERRRAFLVIHNARLERLRALEIQQENDVERMPLARFAADPQNVHTTATVQQTKDAVSQIILIPVPDGYRWNMSECSKTIGEIILECKLTPSAVWQMCSKYAQPDQIYEMEPGIYGKTLDGVWQYIKKSENKEDLCKALKQEMEDNIGMCAQGNLSRLCNILAGYMEGVQAKESISDVLGRRLPKLIETFDDPVERMTEADILFKEVGLPREEWMIWLEPLFADKDNVQIHEKNGVFSLEIDARYSDVY